MTLLLQTEQKQHLNFIVNQPIKVLNKILSNISSGFVNKDNEENSDEENATQAILKLLLDAKHSNLGEKEFFSQVKSLINLNEEQIQILWNFLANENVIDQLITSDEYKFRDLEWRLEAKVASRFLHSQPPDPKIVMKFHLDKEKSLNYRQMLSDDIPEVSRKELVVQANLNNLLHIIEQLESARTSVNMKTGV